MMLIKLVTYRCCIQVTEFGGSSVECALVGGGGGALEGSLAGGGRLAAVGAVGSAAGAQHHEEGGDRYQHQDTDACRHVDHLRHRERASSLN